MVDLGYSSCESINEEIRRIQEVFLSPGKIPTGAENGISLRPVAHSFGTSY